MRLPRPSQSFLRHSRRALAVLLLALSLPTLAAAAPAAPAFEVVALGVEGGLHDGNLSAWLARASGDRQALLLDAGSVLPGIERALQRGTLQPPATADAALSPAGQVLRAGIAGYFISHPHLDHVGGLLIAATDDSRKPIYGLASTLDALSSDYFNWSAWPNFADRGSAPLGQYRLEAHPPGHWFAIAGTSLHGLLLPLQHDRMTSSLLLLRSGDAYLAYFGDTGPDQPQHSDALATAWELLAPLARQGQLKGVLIEASYPDAVPADKLFGHLTPHWLLLELHALAARAGGDQALHDLPVVVTHIKPSLKAGVDPRALIEQQLQAGNDLGVRFLLPRQGDRLTF
jgi:3',5'-cyclic-nucleotide phosphodiesterase